MGGGQGRYEENERETERRLTGERCLRHNQRDVNVPSKEDAKIIEVNGKHLMLRKST